MGEITHVVIGADWVVRPKRRPPFRPSLAPETDRPRMRGASARLAHSSRDGPGDRAANIRPQ
jgi:hypothetical protein